MTEPYISLSDAAETLSASIFDFEGNRMPSQKMFVAMKDAFLNGTLTFYDEYRQPIDLEMLRRTKWEFLSLYERDGNHLGLYGETTTRESINVWLETTGSPHRFPELPTPSALLVEANEIDFTVVATRSELIEAFGRFTGMEKSWFDNLTTSPRLMAARKYMGQGGRHSAEPLFCPYEVMQWLIDPKRKKGRPLGEPTAWRLFKSHFPKVYNQYSIGDPNAD